jgi:hypothetical protein
MEALKSNTTGYANSAMGLHALYSNTTGNYNTADGVNALYDLNITDNTSGNNTAIGYNTGRGIVTGVNNTIIGANVTGLSSALSNNIIIADGSGNRRINVDSLGHVGIASSTPWKTLSVNGTMAISGLPATSAGDVSVCIKSDNSITYGATCGSSVRASKYNIENLASGLQVISRLQPVTFNYIENNAADVGFIAEDIEAIDPRMASYDIKTGELRNWNVREMMAYVVKAMQEQQAEIQSIADMPVPFRASGEVEAGDVVVIDTSSSTTRNLYDGRAITDAVVKKSNTGYASQVVGVVSGALSAGSGIVTDGDVSVALAGRVPVKVTTENGPIKAGDLLVSSSSTPGAAMKYDPNSQFAIRNSQYPAIIGMALADFDPANGQTGLLPNDITEFQVEVTSVTGDTGLLTAYQGKVLVLIKNNYIQPSGISADGLGLSISDDGKIISTRDLDMGGVAILNIKSLASASGNWSLDENGYLTVKKVTSEEYEIDARKKGDLDPSYATAIIPPGQNEILVQNNRVKKNSNVVVTFRGNPGGAWWISDQADGWFKISLASASASEVELRYWVQSVIEDSDYTDMSGLRRGSDTSPSPPPSPTGGAGDVSSPLMGEDGGGGAASGTPVSSSDQNPAETGSPEASNPLLKTPLIETTIPETMATSTP